MLEEKTLSREEAAIHMIKGGRCIHAFDGVRYEYFWQDGRFFKYLYHIGNKSTNVEIVPLEIVPLPGVGTWHIKRSPIKYSKTIWLNVHPEPGCQDEVLVEYLFGKVTGKWIWNRTRTTTCDKEYRITIEEVKD